MMANYNPVHILTFNDYCLEAICKFLTVPDQINFALSCQHFSAILNLYYRLKLENFDTSLISNLTFDQMHSFLQIVKPQSKTLTADVSSLDYALQKQLLALLGNYFTNVDKLTVKSYSELQKTLIQNMHCLQELELTGTELDDEFFNSLRTLKNLKALSIVEGHMRKNCAFPKIPGLEKLTLKYCSFILSNFKQTCQNLPQLTYLSIIGFTYDLDAITGSYIVEFLQQLRTLKIACRPVDCKWIAQLRNLKILHVEFAPQNYIEIEAFFRHLATHQENQLEELDTDSLTLNREIATSISELKKLKVLKCDYSSNEEVARIISNLEELEEVDFYIPFSDNVVLELLNNCFQLKTVRLWYYNEDYTDITRRITEIGKRLNQQALRTGAKLVTCPVQKQDVPDLVCVYLSDQDRWH